jgi:hypothetical protein
MLLKTHVEKMSSFRALNHITENKELKVLLNYVDEKTSS